MPTWTTPLAPSLKLALHVTLTVALHATYFTEIPIWNCDEACGGAEGGGCTRSAAALFFYLLCCLYLYTSCVQLRRGFPQIVCEHPLTGATSTALVYMSKAYMALPFLWVSPAGSEAAPLPALELESKARLKALACRGLAC